MNIVNSISEFLAIIEKLGINNYIFRGQNEPYYGIKANGFREYGGGWDTDKIPDMNYIQNQFKNNILGKISVEEKEHFLAYCQHYGIQTNLIDFSYSPLVALFFACEGKADIKFAPRKLVEFENWDELLEDESKQKMLIENLVNEAKKTSFSQYAQVYLLKKERLIDISDLVRQLNGKNLFDELLKKQEIFLDFCRLVNRHFAFIKDEEMKMQWLVNMSKEYLRISRVYCESSNYPIDGVVGIEEALSRYKDKNDKNKHYRLLNFIKAIKEMEDSGEEFIINAICSQVDEFQNDSKSVPFLILFFKIIELLKNTPIKTKLHFDVYFTYRPPNLFERISNQQGLFIYQPYLYENDNTYNYHELIIQEVISDITIEINNYEKVLNDLALLGINYGTIYNDMDNVAKAVKKMSKRWMEK